MKIIITHILITVFLIFFNTSCIPNFLKNNDSIPYGFEKVDFSPIQNPREMTRASLDKSTSSLNSLNNIFVSYSENIIKQKENFINKDQVLNKILSEDVLNNFVQKLPDFLDNTSLTKAINNLDPSSFVLTTTPLNLDSSLKNIDTSYIFTQITGQQQKVTKLNEIQYFDENNILIDNSNISSTFLVNTYYARNLNSNWNFPLNNTTSSNSNWELLVQCVSAQINIIDKNIIYNIPAWPRVSIIQLNPNLLNTDKYILVKNNLFLDLIKTKNFIPVGNMNTRTLRIFNNSNINFSPQSSIYYSLKIIETPSNPLIGKNYIYFQDGMTNFFSRFISGDIDKENILNVFVSWQALINKSWFDLTRKIDSSYNVPYYTNTIPLNYLNNKNLPVHISSSKDFQNGGIHYIDPNDKSYLLNIPNLVDATSIGLNEIILTNICNNIIKK